MSNFNPTQDERNAAKAALWDTLMEMCGAWQDGSQMIVILHQDDATRTSIVEVGSTMGGKHARPAKRYFRDGCGFETAIAEYRKENDL